MCFRATGLQADWFSSDAPVLDLETYKAVTDADNDLLVLPETWLTNVPSYLPGIPKVIFNQNLLRLRVVR